MTLAAGENVNVSEGVVISPALVTQVVGLGDGVADSNKCLLWFLRARLQEAFVTWVSLGRCALRGSLSSIWRNDTVCIPRYHADKCCPFLPTYAHLFHRMCALKHDTEAACYSRPATLPSPPSIKLREYATLSEEVRHRIQAIIQSTMGPCPALLRLAVNAARDFQQSSAT